MHALGQAVALPLPDLDQRVLPCRAQRVSAQLISNTPAQFGVFSSPARFKVTPSRRPTTVNADCSSWVGRYFVWHTSRRVLRRSANSNCREPASARSEYSKRQSLHGPQATLSWLIRNR